MAFRGLTTNEIAQLDPARAALIEKIVAPPVQSWRQMSPLVNPLGQCLWLARPIGEWVTVLRYEDELIVSSADVPLELEWEKLHEMLRVHGAILHAMLGLQGFTAVLVESPDGDQLPLMPGYFAGTVIDVKSLDKEGTEDLSEQGHDWPEGLAEPWILALDKVASLVNPEHRKSYLKTVPYGIWVLAVLSGKVHVYEVLS